MDMDGAYTPRISIFFQHPSSQVESMGSMNAFVRLQILTSQMELEPAEEFSRTTNCSAG